MISQNQESEKEQKEIDFRWGLVIILAFLVLAGTAGYLLFGRSQKVEPASEPASDVKSVEKSTQSQVDIAQLVEKLNKAKVTLYFSEGCGACQSQREILGEYFDQLNTVSCGENPEKCQDIQYVPTWVVKDKKETGVKTLAELAELVK
jgi:hypothetical protein